MGNCIRVQPAASWADDGDEWAEDTRRRQHFTGEVATAGKERKLLKGEPVAAQPATEVRIKISKKKLEELLRQADVQGLPLHLVLAQLVSGADHAAVVGHGRHWRPALHSIPEVAE